MKIHPTPPDQHACSTVSVMKFLIFKQHCSLLQNVYMPDRNAQLTRHDVPGHKQIE